MARSAEERRETIWALLTAETAPVSASALAGQLGVSRQIIVGDVALLRASGADIFATPRGYLLGRTQAEGLLTRTLACIHKPEEMGAELRAIVDAGGEAVDVIVEHPVYGQLTGVLHIRSRYDVDEFLRRVAENSAKPLSDLTGGIHLHTVRCPDEAAFSRIRTALERAGVLLHM